MKLVCIGVCFLLAATSVFPTGIASQKRIETAQQDDRPIGFCELIRHPGRYNRNLVRVVAKLASSPEGAIFYDDACKQSYSEEDVISDVTFATNYRFDSALDKKLKKLRRKYLMAEVTVVAVFTDGGARTFGHMMCCRYKLEVQELLAVDRVKSKS